MEENPLNTQKDPLHDMGRIIGINLAVFLGQIALIYGMENSIGLLVGIAMFISLPAQLIANIVMAITAFSSKNKTKGIAHLLSFILVLLIGYSACGGYDILTKGLVH